MQTDTFRRNSRPLNATDKRALDDLKVAAEVLESHINTSVPAGRERALAMTKLEESVMWATKGLTG